MAKSFHCRLITPAAQLLDDQVVYASIPAWDGLFGVLANRGPIVAKLGQGELRLDLAERGASRSFIVEDGFVQMVNNKLTILAAKAFPTESINPAEASAELAEAEKRHSTAPDLKTRTADHEKIARERSLARLKVRAARAGKRS